MYSGILCFQKYIKVLINYILGCEWFANTIIFDNISWQSVFDYWRPYYNNQILRTYDEILQLLFVV